MTNEIKTTSQNNRPIYRKQLPHGIGAAVFENTRDGRTYRSIIVQRSYRNDGNWTRMSLYLDHEHIPFFIEALQSTWAFLNDTPITNAMQSDGYSIEENSAIESEQVVESA